MYSAFDHNSISELLIYIGITDSNAVLPIAFVIVQCGASLLCIIYTYNRIRDAQNHLLQADKDAVYADDDEYWIRGYYYNPSDSRTTIEKRYGYGYTYNMATTKGKVIGWGLPLLIIPLLLVLSVMFIRLDTASFSLSINGDTARISAPFYGYSFNVKDIEEVKMMDSVPKGTRTNGAATGKYSLGNFNLNEYGRSKLYVYNENPPFILIKLKDMYIFLNGKTRDKTDEYYRMLTSK